jgi:hypothetical protein
MAAPHIADKNGQNLAISSYLPLTADAVVRVGMKTGYWHVFPIDNPAT